MLGRKANLKNIVFLITVFLILFNASGCINFDDNDNNGNENNNGNNHDININTYRVDAYSMHNISNVNLFEASAKINESLIINLSDKIKLTDKVVDIHIVNQSDEKSFLCRNNTTALCFISFWDNMFFNDIPAGEYGGKGFAIFTRLINKTIEINNTVEITFEVSSRFLDFYVTEDNITVIKE